jgi:hypothetical protein
MMIAEIGMLEAALRDWINIKSNDIFTMLYW